MELHSFSTRIGETNRVSRSRRSGVATCRAGGGSAIPPTCSVQAGHADVVLINMQYSPRTESMIQLGTYLDGMRVVARDRDVPLFDRLGLMRYWNDNGAFDLYAAAKDNVLASKVHDCLGRALASLVIEAAHLEKTEGKAVQ
jgi:hypothetical protein